MRRTALFLTAALLSAPALAAHAGTFRGTEGTYSANCCIVSSAGESELKIAGLGNADAGAVAKGGVSAQNIGEAHSVVNFGQAVGGFSHGVADFEGFTGLQGLAISN